MSDWTWYEGNPGEVLVVVDGREYAIPEAWHKERVADHTRAEALEKALRYIDAEFELLEPLEEYPDTLAPVLRSWRNKILSTLSETGGTG